MTRLHPCYHLVIERVADDIVVYPLGHLEIHHTVWLADERLLAVGDQVGAGRLYLECKRAEFLTSEGLAWLIRLRQRTLEVGGRLVLCNLQPAVREVMEVCRLLPHLFEAHTGNPPGAGPRLIEPYWLAWNDRLIPRLAQQISERRAFHDMPVLGDALEEAGCTNADLLKHCRRSGTHVPACWVLAALRESAE